MCLWFYFCSIFLTFLCFDFFFFCLSGTGVFYQAMPAVGADGKNIMKLIPVQMVNGRFFQSPMSTSQTNSAPQKVITINNASEPVLVAEKEARNRSSTERPIRNHGSFVNSLPNQVNLVLSNSVNKPPMQKVTSNLTAKVSQMAAPLTILGKSVKLPSEHPVTVKSPALPRGQYLQIPPNAQVQRVLASELPPSIKEQIFTSPASSSVYSSSPSVVLVSPVTTMSQGVAEPSGSVSHALRLVSKSPNTTSSVPPRGVQPQLRLIPKVSQRPNSPTRWVIEEVDNSSPENLRPGNSPSPSEILRSVAKGGNNVRQAISQTIYGKDIKGQENALVVCNGKVFFVAKNGSLKFKSTAARESSEVSERVIFPSSHQQSAAPQTRPDVRTLDKSNEVIDLCDDDDDAQEDLPQQASQLDEDNVIFVSYIPPKAEFSTEKEMMLKTQEGLGEKTNLMTSSGSNHRADVPVLGSGQSMLIRCTQDAHSNVSLQSISTQNMDNMEVGATTGSPVDSRSRGEHAKTEEHAAETEENAAGTEENAAGTEENAAEMEENAAGTEEDAAGTEENAAGTEENAAGTEENAAGTEENAAGTEENAAGTEENAAEMEENAPETKENALKTEISPLSEPWQTDHLLRKIFGITADVRISLQKIDEAGPGCFSADLLHTESIRLVADGEKARGFKERELSLQDLYTPQKPDISCGPANVPSVKVQTEHKVSTSLHTSVTPLKSSPSKLNTKHPSRLKENCCSSGQSSLGKTRCSESEPLVSYVEPIDEDFTDENDKPKSQDRVVHPQTQTCKDINASARRVGRTRKRTMCPCCIPSALHPVVKSSARFEEPEECTLTTDQTSKKAGRPKVPRKDGRTSSKISCVDSRSKNSKSHDILSSDGLELKRHEQSERLEDILEEKVAQMRKGMS
ncbi:uncharacterized protein FYW49_004696 [Xenentodon cancila]